MNKAGARMDSRNVGASAEWGTAGSRVYEESDRNGELSTGRDWNRWAGNRMLQADSRWVFQGLNKAGAAR